jgi:hypothetical protein
MRISPWAVGGLAVALSLTSVGVASADEGSLPTPAVVELIEAAHTATEGLDPGTAEVVTEAVERLAADPTLAAATADSTIEQADGSTITVESGNVLEVPADASEPVAVTTASGDVVEITLPVPTGTEAVVVDGLSVFPTEHGSVTQQITDDGGARTLFTLNGPDAPTIYPVQITVNEGGTLRLEPEGSVSIIDAANNVSSGLAPPWAKDANGIALPTWYEVDGNIVTQHIDTSDVSAWPVQADPFWRVFSSYMKCILGIGVPLGVAWAIVASLGTAGALAWAKGLVTAGPKPGTWPGWLYPIRWYVTAVYNNCAYFVRN